MLVHRDVDDLALVGAEDAERTDVAGRLAEHHVARIAEHPGDQVETLLRADGDHDVVGVGGDVLQPITSQIFSRMNGSPWPEPYCMARRPSLRTSSLRTRTDDSSGRSAMLGIPPASETTSGRLATANRARMAEAVMPCVRSAYRSR